MKLTLATVAVYLFCAILPTTSYAITPAEVAAEKVQLVENVDKFTGRKTYSARRGLSTRKSGFLVTFQVSPAVMVPTDQPPFPYVRIHYNGYGWLFLNGSLDILLNGSERMQLVGADSSREREIASCAGGNCLMSESMRIPLTLEQVEAIAAATTVEVRARGSKASVQGELDAKHLAYFRAVGSKVRELNPTSVTLAADEANGILSPAAATGATSMAAPVAADTSNTTQPNFARRDFVLCLAQVERASHRALLSQPFAVELKAANACRSQRDALPEAARPKLDAVYDMLDVQLLAPSATAHAQVIRANEGLLQAIP